MLISHLCNVQLSLGFVLAEDKLSAKENLSKLFYECKGYVVATCQRNIWSDKVDDLCQVGFYCTHMPRARLFHLVHVIVYKGNLGFFVCKKTELGSLSLKRVLFPLIICLLAHQSDR